MPELARVRRNRRPGGRALKRSRRDAQGERQPGHQAKSAIFVPSSSRASSRGASSVRAASSVPAQPTKSRPASPSSFERALRPGDLRNEVFANHRRPAESPYPS